MGRGPRRWLVRVFLGCDRETRQRRYHNRTIHGPARRAQEYLTKMLRERDMGCGLEGAEITLDAFLTRWLDNAAKPKLREKSYESYESLLRRYIRPVLGERILSAITPLDVQDTYQKMIGRGLSARTVRYAHSVLRSAIRQAIRWRLLLQDPTDGAQLPRLGRREMRVLTAAQSRIFLSAALKTHYGPVFAIALTTGMRPSEYLALKWQDLDWDRGTVSVVRTLERTAGAWRFAETKRARSRRIIKLQDWVLVTLKNLKGRTRQWIESRGADAAELVFTSPAGRPTYSDKLAKRFKAILREAGLGGVLLGIGAEVFILPGLDSIAGFTLLFLAVTVISAWIMTSSPRLSYFGVQVVVAFYLINLSEFAVQTSLVLARDRVIGILLGLLVMWLVFDQLWSVSAAMQMKGTFISNLRLLAQFAREPIFDDLRKASERSYSLRETINSNLDRVRDLSGGVLLEFGPSRERDLALRERIIRWQTQVRMLFLTEIALWKYRAQLPGFELPKALVTQQRQFDEGLASTLEGLADRLEGRSSKSPSFEDSVAHHEGNAEVCAKAPEQTFSDRDSALLSLRRRIQNLTNSLTQEI